MDTRKVTAVRKKVLSPSFDHVRRFVPAAAVLSLFVIGGCSSEEESENESAPPEENAPEENEETEDVAEHRTGPPATG